MSMYAERSIWAALRASLGGEVGVACVLGSTTVGRRHYSPMLASSWARVQRSVAQETETFAEEEKLFSANRNSLHGDVNQLLAALRMPPASPECLSCGVGLSTGSIGVSGSAVFESLAPLDPRYTVAGLWVALAQDDSPSGVGHKDCAAPPWVLYVFACGQHSPCGEYRSHDCLDL